jgi:hypothetical protein
MTNTGQKGLTAVHQSSFTALVTNKLFFKYEIYEQGHHTVQ